MVAFSFTVAPQFSLVRAATNFRLHAAIVITNDGEFDVNHGVVRGSGTSLDPYVIEGWEITTGGGLAGIEILGTTKYFIIRNVLVHDVFDSSGVMISAPNGQLANSTITNNGYIGVDIETSTNILIHGDNVSSNYAGGIVVSRSDLVTLSSNNVSRNALSNVWPPVEVSGIEIKTSTRVTVAGNHLLSNDIVPTGSPFQLSSLSISSDNTVNGRPVNYYNGCSGTTINDGPPQEMIFALCNDVQITGTRLSRTGFGVQLLSVKGAMLSGDSFSDNTVGIRVYNSTGITVDTSYLSVNSTGIEVNLSSTVTLRGNAVSSRGSGVQISYSKQVNVSQNQLNATISGIIDGSSSTLTGNKVSGAEQGISVSEEGAGFNVTGNSMINNGIGIQFVGSAGCACWPAPWINGTISSNVIQNNGNGIDVLEIGTLVRPRFNVNITGNDLADNSVGVKVDGAGGVRFYHNNFISNMVQAIDQGYSTIWDNGYPSGGNYWSDFTGKDNCSGPRQDICSSPDGIGDTQYTIGQSIDNYPLMKPFGPVETISPSWPIGSSITASSITQTTVSLSWTGATDDTGILSYRLYNGNNLAAIVSGVAHSFQVTGLTPGTDYTFKVEAVDAWGNNSTSDPTTSVRTSRAGPSTGGSGAPPPTGSPTQPAESLWQQYWSVTIISVVSVAALGSLAFVLRQKGTRNRPATKPKAIPSTGTACL